MPKQGQSVESCIVTEFKKKVGDKVAVGDVLFSYETDKASFDEDAKVAGTVLACFFNDNDEIPCLTNVMVIGEPGESFSEYAPSGSAPAAAQATEAAAPAPSAAEPVPHLPPGLPKFLPPPLRPLERLFPQEPAGLPPRKALIPPRWPAPALTDASSSVMWSPPKARLSPALPRP